MTLAVNIFAAATFDVQYPSIKNKKDGLVLSGGFITDSLADGCFLVIESNASTADIFVAIQRKGSEQVISESIPLPPSSYIVYAYDLEENALPYHIPANIPSPDDHIIINNTGEFLLCILYIMKTFSLSNLTDTKLTITSEFLDSATIIKNESTVVVKCKFYDSVSCILMYREYGNPKLNVMVYKHNTSFLIDNPRGKEYSFAVFGRNNVTHHIDRVPATTLRVVFNNTVTSAEVIFEANKIPPTIIPSPSPLFPTDPGMCM